MQHQEGFFNGIRNTNIYYQYWRPEKPKAVVLIVHGLSEHSGRYMNVVNRLVPAGYAVYSLDHLGHGRSDGTKVHVETFADYTETLKLYFDIVHTKEVGTKETADYPFFLLGHSMGGLIASAYLLEHQADFIGAILSAPAIKPPGEVPFFIKPIARFMSKYLPKREFVQLDTDAVSRDPDVVKAYVDDPLVYLG
ncbi:MAG: lysophospholipase [Chloroflexota bacterium]